MRLSLTRSGLRITLGLIWLLDGGLQFQSFMYSHGFLKEVIEPSAAMQPAWIGHSILSAAHFAGHNLTLWNTLFALTQVGIGLGLIFRRTARPALLASFVWALVVWWFGEGLGMIPSGMASPLTGAPGAALLYGLIGLLVWPTEETEREDSSAGAGLIGERGGRLVWSALWLTATALWCLSVNHAAGATSEALKTAAGGSMHWLASLQTSLAGTTKGHGEAIAIALAILSLTVAAGVWTRWRRAALLIGAGLSIAYWFLGQSLGALTSGMATDPNAGPLFVLLSLALLPRRHVTEGAVGRSSARGARRAHSPAGLQPPLRTGLNKLELETFNKGEKRMQSSANRTTSGQRWAALGALLAITALGVSGCGGSSSAKSEASVALKPMTQWDALGSNKQQTAAMKGMSSSAMKKMNSAAGGIPYVASSASGEGHFEQVGDHLTGWRRVTGLVPYSRHANHLHGPDGSCSPASKQTSNMAVVLPDLVANGKGEAYGTINLTVHQQIVGPGYFLMVHAKPTPASEQNQIGSAPASMAFMQAMSNDPAILCGNIKLTS
jgi:hypothetical protein